MKYKVLGRRVLLKVKRFKKEELKHVEGSSLILAPDKTHDDADLHTATQTVGEIIGLGELAYLNDDGSLLGGQERPVKLGDKVHFQRYGAVRLNFKEKEVDEYWVVEDKDLFAVDIIKQITKHKEKV